MVLSPLRDASVLAQTLYCDTQPALPVFSAHALTASSSSDCPGFTGSIPVTVPANTVLEPFPATVTASCGLEPIPSSPRDIDTVLQPLLYMVMVGRGQYNLLEYRQRVTASDTNSLPSEYNRFLCDEDSVLTCY